MLSTPSADTTQTTPSYPPENFLCPWVSFARDQLNLHSHKQSTQPHCAQQLVVQGGSDLLVLWSTFAPEEGSQHDGDLNHHGILFSYGMCSPCELIKHYQLEFILALPHHARDCCWSLGGWCIMKLCRGLLWRDDEVYFVSVFLFFCVKLFQCAINLIIVCIGVTIDSRGAA